MIRHFLFALVCVLAAALIGFHASQDRPVAMIVDSVVLAWLVWAWSRPLR